MKKLSVKVYFEEEGNFSLVKNKTIAIIGYGNQARAQALNMRDSGLNIIIGTITREHEQRAKEDNFTCYPLSDALKKASIYFLLISDDLMEKLYPNDIEPFLEKNDTIVLYSGYNVAFGKIIFPKHVNILLISPRVPGEGLRENFLTNKGVFSFIHAHQDFTGNALNMLLALSKAVGALSRGAIDITLRQQAILNLFFEQTLIQGFLQIMMRSILTLIEKGYSPEAIFVELFLSGEGGYTLDKVIDVGMIKQMNFHSQTSQYGQMSRGTKFRTVAGDIGAIQKKIFQEINNGDFASEWAREESKIRLALLKYHASNIKFAEIEKKVRENLGFRTRDLSHEIQYPSEDLLVKYPQIKKEIEIIKSFYRKL